MPASTFSPVPPLVLVSCGVAEVVVPRLQRLASSLASRLGWGWIDLPDVPAPATFEALLAAPESSNADGPLALLPVDPGQWIVGFGTWAEALGAWRQPVLVAVPAEAHRSGTPAALVALLHQEGVPLVGLIQIGGVWEPDHRRQDGLPWLGCWPQEVQDPGGHALGDPGEELAEELAQETVIHLRRALQRLAAGQ